MKPDRDSIHRRAIRLGAAALVVGLLSGALLDDVRVAARSIRLTGAVGDHIEVGGDLVVWGQTIIIVGMLPLPLLVLRAVRRREPAAWAHPQ